MGYRTTKYKIKVESNKTNSYTEFFYKAFRNILLVSIPLVIISALFLSLPRSIAIDTSSVDKLELSLPVSCTLSSKIDTAHNATILNGTNKEDIGKTILTTFCNDQNGYVVYAIGATNNVEGSNVLVSSANDGANNYDIETGTATSGNKSNWSMKLSTNNIGNIINNSDETVATNQSGDTPVLEPDYNNIYGLVPDDWVKVAFKTAGTVNSESGSSFTTTYAVYTSPTQPAGAYSGQVKYVMLHPSSSNKPTTLAQAYQNAGKSKVAITDPITGESGEYYKMQDMTTAICDATNTTGEASQLQLVDIRDNKLYYVTKLLDGRCWMTQNLALNLSSSTPLTSNETDLNDNTGMAYSDGYSIEDGVIQWLPANNTLRFNNFSISGWTVSEKLPYSATKEDDYSKGHNSIGNYYNWSAAIASNNSKLLTSNTIDDITNNPQNSICPKGWRLPTISNESEFIENTTNEFSRLNYLYNNGSTNSYVGLRAGPLYFALGGLIYGSLINFESAGLYWSSTVSSVSGAYRLYLRNNLVDPVYNYTDHPSQGRFGGYSVRCIAR